MGQIGELATFSQTAESLTNAFEKPGAKKQVLFERSLCEHFITVAMLQPRLRTPGLRIQLEGEYERPSAPNAQPVMLMIRRDVLFYTTHTLLMTSLPSCPDLTPSG